MVSTEMELPDASLTDEEMEWEELGLSQVGDTGDIILDGFDLELTVGESVGKKNVKRLDEKERLRINIERQARHVSHKLHALALLANASVRNTWLNDPLLHARLMSLTPLPLQNHFLMIHKKNQPDASRRGRLFESALIKLTQWWHDEFGLDPDKSKNVRSRTFADVQKHLRSKGISLAPRMDPTDYSALPTGETQVIDKKGKGKMRARSDDEETAFELIRSSKSLMKHALMMRGTRDTSAQLFTALCRALGIPARLVVSLQAVPWKSLADSTSQKPKKGKPKATKSPADEAEEAGSDDDFEAVILAPDMPLLSDTTGTPRNGKEKAGPSFPGKGTVLGGSGKRAGEGALAELDRIMRRPYRSGSRPVGLDNHLRPPPEGWPPVFWTEVFSRPDGRWIPVDPSRNLVNRKRLFQPPSHDKNNRMVYVVAFEEDGYARDVTPRYAKEFGAKTAKLRVASTRGKKDWWDSVASLVARPYRLNRDDVEDAELLTNQVSEGMPASVIGFKDHPLYALERHLKRDEVIHPRTEIGKFRGEPVFPRANLVTLKTSENWMRQGREVKEGAQPLKHVKINAATIAKKRALEMAQLENEREGGHSSSATQAMYAEWQTKFYLAPPVRDGKVPKNDFGNIDLYTPSMLPAGSVHLPYKGIAKVARSLGVDHAEAVTGFEFKKRRALPILTGIVIPVQFEAKVLEAYWETAQAAEERERQKKEERVIKHWSKLIAGLRVRDRLMSQYSEYGRGDEAADQTQTPDALPPDPSEGGGFLLNEHDIDVVLPYSLPKMLHQVMDAPGKMVVTKVSEDIPDSPVNAGDDEERHSVSYSDVTQDIPGLEEDRGEENTTSVTPADENVVPKTMEEYANEFLVGEGNESSENGSDAEAPVTPGSTARRSKRLPRPVQPKSEQTTPIVGKTRPTRARPRQAVSTKSSVSSQRKTTRKAKSPDPTSEEEQPEASDSFDGESSDEVTAKKPARANTRSKGTPRRADPLSSDRVLRSRKAK